MSYATTGRHTTTYYRPVIKSGIYHDSKTKPVRKKTSHYKDYSNCTKMYVKPLDTSDIYYYEALILESGAVLVGTDVFRLLLNDIPSHKVNAFPSIDALLEKYRIVERNYY